MTDAIDDELRPIAALVDHDLALFVVDVSPADPTCGKVPAYKFEIRVDGVRVGSCDLRLGATDHLVRYGGQVGYGISPPYRGRRYAARACKLMFGLARARGMREIWITCNPDNVPSRITCERVGGELIEIVDLPPDTDMYREGERKKCRYRVTL